ncbi:uncharacterized protein [Battus philenor]|uniref:uncharacterized protein n=1 Tax=Battus philenor TaxID=42288 RepID=UPI0035D031A4
MKCNTREIALLSDQPCVMEGRLNYKKIANGGYRNQAAVFKERWFRLINNYLFYFKISEMGKFDTKNPAGVFIMENTSIQMEHGQSISFSFSISFIDEPEKRHIFAARSEDNVVQWVMKLRKCSYEYLRNQLHTLQSKIYSITGKDPLLLVPRNEGACLWAPSVPFSTAPACTVNTSSFSCHLHTNGAFTLERSKSDVQTYKKIHEEYRKKAIFYTNDQKQKGDEPENKEEHGFTLEKSKTSALFASSNLIDLSIFDNRPAYSRAAPSPPVRTKLSPSSRRTETTVQNVQMFTEQKKYLHVTGILDEVPIPPRRKLSPKPVTKLRDNEDNTEETNSFPGVLTEDLIQF